MIETPLGNIRGIDDESITLLELRNLFKAIDNVAITRITYAEYNHRTHSVDNKSFEISKIIRCKDCGKRYANGCRFYMSMIETEDDFFCGDAEQKGGDSQ